MVGIAAVGERTLRRGGTEEGEGERESRAKEERWKADMLYKLVSRIHGMAGLRFAIEA